MPDVWKNVDRIRKENDWSWARLAIAAGMSPKNLSGIKAKSNPTLKTLEKLAKALDVKVGAFFLE